MPAGGADGLRKSQAGRVGWRVPFAPAAAPDRAVVVQPLLPPPAGASHQSGGASGASGDRRDAGGSSDGDDDGLSATPRRSPRSTAATRAAQGPAVGGAQKRKLSGDKRSKGGTRARKKPRGFVDAPRPAFRALEGRTAIVDGNQRSCGQDALVNGAKALGVPVTKKQVHHNTLPPKGDTEVGVIVGYARDKLKIEMLDTRIPATLGRSLFQQEGGPEHALLQLTEGVFFVELTVSQKGKPDDAHAVIYNASYTVPEGREPQHYAPLLEAGYTPERFHLIRGAVIDNEKDTPVKFIEPSDREMVADASGGKPVPAARKVFASLFPFASCVRVVGAWLMCKQEEAADEGEPSRKARR